MTHSHTIIITDALSTLVLLDVASSDLNYQFTLSPLEWTIVQVRGNCILGMHIYGYMNEYQ
jgi:hypothetical protein